MEGQKLTVPIPLPPDLPPTPPTSAPFPTPHTSEPSSPPAAAAPPSAPPGGGVYVSSEPAVVPPPRNLLEAPMTFESLAPAPAPAPSLLPAPAPTAPSTTADLLDDFAGLNTHGGAPPGEVTDKCAVHDADFYAGDPRRMDLPGGFALACNCGLGEAPPGARPTLGMYDEGVEGLTTSPKSSVIGSAAAGAAAAAAGMATSAATCEFGGSVVSSGSGVCAAGDD